MTTLELEKLINSARHITNSAASFARLDLESLVDTGSAVPITIALQAPPDMAFRSFSIYAPDNPASLVMQLKLGVPLASYRFEVRIRLGASQNVWLIAHLQNDRVMGMSVPTVITSSACFDAS